MASVRRGIDAAHVIVHVGEEDAGGCKKSELSFQLFDDILCCGMGQKFLYGGI